MTKTGDSYKEKHFRKLAHWNRSRKVSYSRLFYLLIYDLLVATKLLWDDFFLDPVIDTDKCNKSSTEEDAQIF